MKAEDLAGLESLLDGNPGTVSISQEAFRRLIDEIKAKGLEEESESKSAEAQLRLKVRRIVARIEVLRLHDAIPEHDVYRREVCWLVRYTKHLLEANMELLFHLERLTSNGFMPRVKLEAALKDEVS